MSDKEKTKKKQSDGISESIDLLNKLNELQESNEACIEALSGSSYIPELENVANKLTEISDCILDLTQKLMEEKYSKHKLERENRMPDETEKFSPVMMSSPSLDLRR